MDAARQSTTADAAEQTPVVPWLALGLLALALLLLLLVPIVVRQRSDAIRRNATEVAEPARDLTEDLSRDMAIQADAVRLFALSRDPVNRVRARAAADNAQRALRELKPLAAELGPRLAQRVDRLQASWAVWRQITDALLEDGRPITPVNADSLERAFQATINASADLDTDIGRMSATRRAQARRIDTYATIVTVALVLIVVTAMLALALLSSRLSALAEVSRVRAQQEEALRQQIQTAMEGRARLIRGFSHDVRNPLGAADGYGQLLESGVYGELSERQVEAVHRLRRAIGAAVLLTDDLLDLARLEAGQLQTTAEPMDLLALVRETVDDYQAQARAARLELVPELPEAVVPIQSDERRIRQILSNLLSNAIKYTPQGGRVTVRLNPERRTVPGNWIGVMVSDTGPGIAPEQRARVFEEFSRLEPAAARGAGLGLAISRRLARALGGDITLESAPGAGSNFTLWLPADRPA